MLFAAAHPLGTLLNGTMGGEFALLSMDSKWIPYYIDSIQWKTTSMAFPTQRFMMTYLHQPCLEVLVQQDVNPKQLKAVVAVRGSNAHGSAHFGLCRNDRLDSDVTHLIPHNIPIMALQP